MKPSLPKVMQFSTLPVQIRKDYPTTGVLKLSENKLWELSDPSIRKDYPTTGVLKLRLDLNHSVIIFMPIRKDYPTTGVLKLGGAWR